MTITAAPPRQTYLCDGVTTVFPVPIQAYLATDFEVILTAPASAGGTDTVLTLNSQYALTSSGTLAPPQWTLTTQGPSSPFTAGYTLQIICNPSQNQLTQYVAGQAFPSLAVQTNFDRLTQMVQRLQDQLNRAVIAPDGDVSPTMMLANAAGRALMALVFDVNGNVSLGAIPTTAFTQSNFNAFLLSAPGLAPYYPLTAIEQDAAIAPVSFAYPSGVADRYAVNTFPGTTDMTFAIQTAINVAAASGGGAQAQILGEQYLISSTLTIPSGVTLKGVNPGGGSYGGTAGSSLYVNSPITALKLFSGNTSSPCTFAKVLDLSVVLGPSANGATGLLMYAAWYCTVSNLQFSAPGSGVAFAVGIQISGGNGIGNFGNNVNGGYIFQCAVGVKFTSDNTQSSPTQPTNTTFTGTNIFGTGPGASTTAIMVQFATPGAGQASTFTGGFWENYQYGAKFGAASQTTWSVQFNNPYLNGASNGGFDLFLSSNDGYIFWTAASNPASGAPTCNLTPLPASIDILSAGINGVALTNAHTDISSVGVGHPTSLRSTTAASLSATAVGGGTGGGTPTGPLTSLTSGVQNTGIGYQALNAITTQNSNTAVGASALAGASNTGGQNTAVGVSAGSANTSGGNNTAVGYGAQAGSSGSDNTAIGYQAIIGTTAGSATGNDQVLIGDANVLTLYCKQTSITTTSDERDKSNVVPLPHGLALIKDVNVREWDWAHRTANRLDGSKEQGVVAQELQAVIEKHGAQSLRLVDTANPDQLGARPGALLMPLIVAVQELAARLEKLEKP